MIPIPIPQLPSIAAQVADYAHALSTRGSHPASVPETGRPRVAAAVPRRRTSKPREIKSPGAPTIEEQILRAARGLRPIWKLHDLIGELPTCKISSVKAVLTKMVSGGALQRVGLGRYRVAP